MPISPPIQKITACAFIHRQGKLFIARRAATKKFLPGKYELPGGHIEFGEALDQGLKREIVEEFGFQIHVGNPFHAFTYTRDDNTIHSVEIDFLATLVNPNQTIKLNPSDHSEYHWVSATKVDDYFDPKDEELTAIRKGFQAIQSFKKLS